MLVHGAGAWCRWRCMVLLRAGAHAEPAAQHTLAASDARAGQALASCTRATRDRARRTWLGLEAERPLACWELIAKRAGLCHVTSLWRTWTSVSRAHVGVQPFQRTEATRARTDGRTDARAPEGFARTHARTHARTDGRTDGRTHGRTDGWTDKILALVLAHFDQNQNMSGPGVSALPPKLGYVLALVLAHFD